MKRREKLQPAATTQNQTIRRHHRKSNNNRSSNNLATSLLVGHHHHPQPFDLDLEVVPQREVHRVGPLTSEEAKAAVAAVATPMESSPEEGLDLEGGL